MPWKVAIYTRVSSAENTYTLDSQAERLVAYCAARGYPVAKVVKEVGSGINDARPKFLALLEDQRIGMIVVEQKDRATRFGFRNLETLLKTQGRAIEVVNHAENSSEDLLCRLTSIVYAFCARLYGQRRAKRKRNAFYRNWRPSMQLVEQHVIKGDRPALYGYRSSLLCFQEPV